LGDGCLGALGGCLDAGADMALEPRVVLLGSDVVEAADLAVETRALLLGSDVVVEAAALAVLFVPLESC
jgi:hypothetical protein